MVIKYLKIYVFLGLAIILTSANSHAQQATLQGQISDDTSGDILEGANVVLTLLADSTVFLGAASDQNGFYQIENIRLGRYQLKVSYLGFVTLVDTLNFETAGFVIRGIGLEPDEEVLGELVIEQFAGSTVREAGRQRIAPAELGRVPTPAAGGDLVSYLQTLPGVVSLGSRGGQVFIRGGSPSENMVLVDDILIYKPFHIVGFFSPFPQDLISSADFYAGGFSPSFNGRISSVVDVNMRHGDRYEYRSSGSVSPFLADFTMEGPFGSGYSSWIVSVRRSILESSSSLSIFEDQPLKFESHYGKVSFTTNDVSCSALSMHTYDRGRLNYQSNETIRWGNFLVGGKCQVVPDEGKTFLETDVNFSHMWNAASNLDQKDSFSDVSRFYADAEMTNYYKATRLNYGVFLNFRFTNFDLVGRFQDLDEKSASLLNLGAHFEAAVSVSEKFSISPGIVLSALPNIYDLSLEPRMRLSYKPKGRKEEDLSASVGIYRQPIVGISDMRDASSVFVIWMRAPIGGSQMQAIHGTLSWQQTFENGLSWSIETYYKDLKYIPVQVWTTVARIETDLTLANGYSYGSDVRVEYNRGRYYALVGYGYSYTLYESAQDNFGLWFGEPIQSFNPPHDRRHQLNTTGSISLGNYVVGARWQFGTGVPFTQPIGFDEVLFFDEGLPDVRETVGTRRAILDKPFDERLPVYHRLDISIERDFYMTSKNLLSNVKVGVINAYDRSNVFFYDIFTDRRSDQISFFPYVTFKIGNS